MDLILFPHDTQTCVIDFSSCKKTFTYNFSKLHTVIPRSDAYTVDDILYLWDPIKPLDVDRKIVDCMPKFTVGQVTNETCNVKTATGELMI